MFCCIEAARVQRNRFYCKWNKAYYANKLFACHSARLSKSFQDTKELSAWHWRFNNNQSTIHIDVDFSDACGNSEMLKWALCQVRKK